MIRSIVPPGWFIDSCSSSIAVRIFKSVLSDEFVDNFSHKLRSQLAIFDVSVTPCYGEMNLRSTKIDECFTRKGIVVYVTGEDSKSQEGYHCIIATPSKRDGEQIAEAMYNQVLDKAIAVLCSVFGRSFLYKCIFRGEFTAEGDVAHMHSPVFRMPMPIERTPINAASERLALELFEAMSGPEAEKKERHDEVIHFLFRGVDTKEFINYWTALEILSGGKVINLKKKMHKAYGIKEHDVNDKLGLKRFVEWRNNLIHNGKHVSLSAEVERLLQFLIMDLMCKELNLECRNCSSSQRRL